MLFVRVSMWFCCWSVLEDGMEYWDFFYVDRIFVLIFRVGVKFCNVGVWSVCFGDEVVMVGEVEWKRDWGF